MSKSAPAAAFLAAALALSPVFSAAAAQADEACREITWAELLSGVNNIRLASEKAPAAGEVLNAYLEERQKSMSRADIQGKNIKIHGFVVPLERDDDASLKEFLLVPYFGACIHVPPPPQDQIIHVRLAAPAKGIKAMDTLSVCGRIELEKSSFAMGDAAYSISNAAIEQKAALSPFAVAAAAGVTLLCGMSVCAGWVGPIASARLSRHPLGCGMGFGAGALLCLGLSSLAITRSVTALCLFGAGFLCMTLIERLLHAHACRRAAAYGEHAVHLGSAIAISFHNMPECFIVFSSAVANPGLGFVLGGVMIAHNAPLGLSLALLSERKLPRRQAWGYAFLAGVLPPIAAMLAYFSLRSLLSPAFIRLLFAAAGGALTFIAMAELFPRAWSSGSRLKALGGFGAGFLFLSATLLYTSME